MGGYSRPEGGWRAHFQGIKTNAPADAIEATKSPYSQNIRGIRNQTIATRPGYVTYFDAVASVTDIRAYATLGTDNKPRCLARNSNNQIYLDNGSLVATLSGTSLGAFMIPFRPNNSPQSWMYIGTQLDYKKLSAPDASNVVTAYDVGIEEQQNPPSVCPQSFAFYQFTSNAAGWVQGGTAGAPADSTRLAASNIVSIFADPASGSDLRYSLEVISTDDYQVGMIVNIDKAGDNFFTVVQDVLPPITTVANLVISSIYYYSGTTGRCVITAAQFPSNATAPMFTGSSPQSSSIYSDSVIASIRRSAIIKLTHGATVEKCFVLSTTAGPDGAICFEVSTTNTFVATDLISGLGAIVVTGVNGVLANDTIEAADITSALTGAGTGTISQALGTNPFTQLLAPTNGIAQQDDYIGIGINVNDLSKLVVGTIKFNVGDAVDYATDFFYAQFTPNDLVFHPPATTQVTQVIDNSNDPNSDPSFLDGRGIQTPPTTVTITVPLPSSQWTTLFFPIRQLVRSGNNLNKTLTNCNGIQISFQASASINVAFAGIFLGGGGHADVGTNPPLFYIVRGRSSLTGAKSNPSPATRYNVSPRRQSVLLHMTDTSGDSQMNTWDVFRFGSTVQSWRYIGSTKNTGGADTFIDNYFDSSVLAGDLLEYNNFEPWPTVDVPFNISTGVVAGITTAISVTGTTILVTWSSANAFTNPAPATILRWLPGTLISLGSQTAYTLWDRPTAATLAAPPAAHYYAYLFQLVENAGSPSPTNLSILEPKVANQHLPYLWGPDAAGTVFGAGDPFRPGSFYFAKSNQPDSAPDSYNQELTPPSEPLLGGEVLSGISLVASSSRWWKLYQNFGSTVNRYQPVEAPVGRGLAAPYAHCTDGKFIFFVAKDGIWLTAGGAGTSLTDEDLYNIFPHEGVNTPQNYTYGGRVLHAPDYQYAGDFRLSFCNSYLYFDYRDSTGTPRTLVCDLRDLAHPAWCLDVYGDPITRHYAIEQQESTVLTAGQKYSLLVMGDSNGKVWTETVNNNDNDIPIIGTYCTFEYNGGDIREDQLYNDAFIDLFPKAAVNITPMTDGVAQASATVIPAASVRIQTNVPVGSELKYMGVLMSWIDDFTTQSLPTEIDAWQPMYQGVPVSVFHWKTQGTAFGWTAYGHLRQWNFAYRATAPVTIVVTAEDGTSPANLTLPSTGGVLQKAMFSFTFNKGMLYDFLGTSDEEWSPYLSESELFAGEWGRQGPYQLVHDIEGPVGIRS